MMLKMRNPHNNHHRMLIRSLGTNLDYIQIAAEDGYVIYAHKDIVDSDAR